MREEACPWKSGVVLICKNQRGPGAAKPSCGEESGHELKSWLKKKAREAGGGLADARVLTTSCLNLCPETGVAVALEPGGRAMVVDADHDRDALLETLKSHFDEAQAAPSGGGLARRAFSRLRRS
jgi:predicted metal-binding protein